MSINDARTARQSPTQIDGSGRTPATEGEPLALMWNKASVFQAAKRRKNFAPLGLDHFRNRYPRLAPRALFGRRLAARNLGPAPVCLRGFADLWLGAVGAAACVDGNLTEALGAFLCCGIGWGRVFAHARDQCVHRSDDEEINGAGGEQEGDGGVDKVADVEVAAVDRELEVGELFALADDRSDDRSEQVFREGSNDGGESRADDDADRHVHNVSTEDEFLESV
jgi:hypothetical protein